MRQLTPVATLGRAVGGPQPRRAPRVIVDHGCGWGSMLLDALAAAPAARGIGVDVHGPDIERAHDLAAQRGLGDRVTFINGSSAEVTHQADLLINIGAYQSLGTVEEALRQLAQRLRPGGRVLFGSEIWLSQPNAEELAVMWEGASADDCLEPPDLVELVHAAGWRVLDLHDSTRTEFDALRWVTCASGRSGCSTIRATRCSGSWTASGPPGCVAGACRWAS